MSRHATTLYGCDGCHTDLMPRPVAVRVPDPGGPGWVEVDLCPRCAARLLPAALELLAPGAAREWLARVKATG